LRSKSERVDDFSGTAPAKFTVAARGGNRQPRSNVCSDVSREILVRGAPQYIQVAAPIDTARNVSTIKLAHAILPTVAAASPTLPTPVARFHRIDNAGRSTG